ncbi:hypothetical protein BJ742DRAFT_849098, partial [Cladochytrium replicatum]
MDVSSWYRQGSDRVIIKVIVETCAEATCPVNPKLVCPDLKLAIEEVGVDELLLFRWELATWSIFHRATCPTVQRGDRLVVFVVHRIVVIVLKPNRVNAMPTPHRQLCHLRGRPLCPSKPRDHTPTMSRSRPQRAYASASAYGYTGGPPSFMESENDDQADLLSTKTNALRELSLKIGEELTFQNGMLDEMHHDMSKTEGTLDATIKRLSQVARQQSAYWMWYLMGIT